MKRVLSCMPLVLLFACDSGSSDNPPAEADPAKASEANEVKAPGEAGEPAEEPAGEPPGGSEVEPSLYKNDAVWGKVSSGGEPVAGAWMVVHGTKQTERSPLPEDGTYAWQVKTEESGDPPYTVSFGADGFAQSDHTVESVPAKGVELNVELKPK